MSRDKIWKTLKFGLNLCLPYKLKFKGEMTNWQFDWGGRL